MRATLFASYDAAISMALGACAGRPPERRSVAGRRTLHGLPVIILLSLAVAAVTPGQSRAANPSLMTLVSFCADTNCTNGANSYADLIADAEGNLFGTTAQGGANGGGTVFKIAKIATGYASIPTTLVSFSGSNGRSPYGGLVADAKGNLFGTTVWGGASNWGTVFEIVKTAGSYASAPTTLVSFCPGPVGSSCPGGGQPYAGLIADAGGNLFGTNTFNGVYSGGTVFEVVKTAGGYSTTTTTLLNFGQGFSNPLGRFPYGGLVADAKGNLFGTTIEGGAIGAGLSLGSGTAYEIIKTTGGYRALTNLVNFTDGDRPHAAMIVDAKGNLFGTTTGGGAYNWGTVFKIVKTAGGYANTPITLASFNNTNGAYPYARLIADAEGNLFGTTAQGGANGRGTVFKIAKTANGYANTPITLVSFCAMAECADGEQPYAGLIADAEGSLFGTTVSGGAYGYGTVFEITGSGFVVPVTFAGTPGKPNCHGKSVSALARQYGGLNAAAAALGYPSVQALQNAILDFCELDDTAEKQ